MFYQLNPPPSPRTQNGLSIDGHIQQYFSYSMAASFIDIEIKQQQPRKSVR